MLFSAWLKEIFSRATAEGGAWFHSFVNDQGISEIGVCCVKIIKRQSCRGLMSSSDRILKWLPLRDGVVPAKMIETPPGNTFLLWHNVDAPICNKGFIFIARFEAYASALSCRQCYLTITTHSGHICYFRDADFSICQERLSSWCDWVTWTSAFYIQWLKICPFNFAYRPVFCVFSVFAIIELVRSAISSELFRKQRVKVTSHLAATWSVPL